MSGTALDTLVNGDPDACESSAGALDQLAASIQSASDGATKARNTGAQGWFGPACDAMTASTKTLPKDLDDMHADAQTASRALRHFGGSLRSVLKEMKALRTMAQNADIDVQGTIIVQPTEPDRPPGPAGQPGLDVPGVAEHLPKAVQKQANAYNQAIGKYQKQMRIWHQIVQRWKAARKKEAQAHADLRSAFANAKLQGTSAQGWQAAAVAGAMRLLGGAKAIDMEVRDTAEEVRRYNEQGKFLWKLTTQPGMAVGRDGGEAPVVAQWRETMKKQGIAEKSLAEWESRVGRISPKVWSFFSANPARLLNMEHLGDHAPPGTTAASKVLRGVGLAGAGATGIYEGYKMMTGQETVKQGTVNIVSTVGGGAAGGALLSRLISREALPEKILVGALGGMLGDATFKHVLTDTPTPMDDYLKDHEISSEAVPDQDIQKMIDAQAQHDPRAGNMSPEEFRRIHPTMIKGDDGRVVPDMISLVPR